MSFSGSNMGSSSHSSCFFSHRGSRWPHQRPCEGDSNSTRGTAARLSDEYEEAFRRRSYEQLTREAQQQQQQWVPLPPLLSRHQSPRSVGGDEITDDGLHHLVAAFLNTALAALDLSGLLLASIDRVKAHTQSLHRAIRLRHVGAAVSDLTRLGDLISPLLPASRVRELFDPLIPRLSKAQRKAGKQARILSLCSRTIVAPCAAARSWRRKKIRSLARTRAQLGAAERGAFTLVREFDTLSRMVARLGIEIEWRRDALEMVAERAGSCEEGGGHVMLLFREVVVQFQRKEKSFDEQLSELERHVYLFMLTVKRSTWLINREMTHKY